MLTQLNHKFAELSASALQAAYTHGPIAGLCAVFVLVAALLIRLYPQLRRTLLNHSSPVAVTDVQVIIRPGDNGARQREVVFKILNGTASPVRVVEGIVTIFGLNDTAIHSQRYKLCNVPEGIEPVSMKLIRTGEGFKVPAHVIPKRVEVQVKNWS